jgi:cysteine synthase B
VEKAVLRTENFLEAQLETFSKSYLEASVGDTPLIRLRRVVRNLPAEIEIYAKAEHLNPGGSVKDRAALAIILAGEEGGKLTRGKTILDATSGNTGIAYAMIGAARGYRVTLCLPSNASVERKRILKIYGAEIVETDAMNGTDGAQKTAKELVKKFPDRYFYADQYNNEANWRAHFDRTALEIWQQTGGRITHFVAGLGTSGTFVGATRRLKQYNPKIQAISMQPDSPLHGLEGMKHMATAIVPGIYDAGLADENVTVATEDAQATTRRLAREEGLLVGISAGANVFAACRLAETLKKEAVIVTVLCDGGGKYLSESFWDAD